MKLKLLAVGSVAACAAWAAGPLDRAEVAVERLNGAVETNEVRLARQAGDQVSPESAEPPRQLGFDRDALTSAGLDPGPLVGDFGVEEKTVLVEDGACVVHWGRR